MFKCESCNLEFDNKATLLRHISHKKVCKLHYGEERFQDMKIEGKLESKRKWWKNHANEAKEVYKSNSEEIRKKRRQKYINFKDRFESDEGIAFHSFHGFLYDCSKDVALENMKNSELVRKKVHEIAKHLAIDKVFEAEPTVFCNQDRNPQFCKYFARDADKDDFDEEDYPVAIEKAMEEAFKKLHEEQFEIEMKNWIEVFEKQLKDKCNLQCCESSFELYFKDFSTTLFPSIQNKSLDIAFAKFDEEELMMWTLHPEVHIEKLLKSKYEWALRDESMKTAIDSEMSFELRRRIDMKIEKQARAMKARKE